MTPFRADRCACPVCGSAELRTDEVVDGERWLLGECPRCEHRFTLRLEPTTTLRGVRPRVAEVSAAA